ncbi:helix-turn-helix domain-containing protein [Streptomyces sp. NPDC058623]|uniref:helix-turn-helix domain-containing protein n=1 Tax=Streptomyces sp. NPDC058623 TaxID=3346563 RepID=UPI0036473849
MPFARPLSGGVYELRPTLDGVATRITYWFAPGRGIVLLTVLKKLPGGDPESAEAEAERAEIRLAMAFAKAVHDRRKALGLSQAELAARAGLTQAKISRVEGADAVPALSLLRRLAGALDASLNIALDADLEQVTFVARTAA